MIYMLGNKQLEKLTCVACTEPFGEHSKRQLIRCLFRVQGTMISDTKPAMGNELDKYDSSKAECTCNDNSCGTHELEAHVLSDGDIADGRREGHIKETHLDYLIEDQE